ncbi:hypothetical protein [Phytobacter massiliensis]|uniref:hypothetical protein n=1 Tax=Phytobacter massiliensis TaxID=1485952 RepID=UPI00030EC29B|nr:hypothetical protein [Phytobacter massiliensis]
MNEYKTTETHTVSTPAPLRNTQQDRSQMMFNDLTAKEQIAIILKRHREIVSSLVKSI